MDFQVLYDKLAHMDCSEIRAFLNSQGITGDMNESHSCVLARAFYQLTDSSSIQVEPGSITRKWWGREFTLLHTADFPCTSEMTSFIQWFDGGHFPELVTQYAD